MSALNDFHFRKNGKGSDILTFFAFLYGSKYKCKYSKKKGNHILQIDFSNLDSKSYEAEANNVQKGMEYLLKKFLGDSNLFVLRFDIDKIASFCLIKK